jgi:hypothetical protein
VSRSTLADGPGALQGRRWRTWAIRFAAAVYLLGVWLEGVGWGAPVRAVLPHWISFFTEVAALFTRAGQFSIEYRAEAYVCDAGEWRELDTRAYFPIDENDKENRFQRVMYFYRHRNAVMHAVDRFLVDSHNDLARDDGIPSDEKIGGVRLLSLRGPLPEIGAPLSRVHRVPLTEIPKKERNPWFTTSSAKITERCFGKRPHQGRPKEEPNENPSVDGPADPHPNEETPSDPRPKEDLP